MSFLPMSNEDLKQNKVEQLDFICITGDAYVDHPSFGIAIISRYLESLGYSVGIIAQPNPDKPKDFTALGKPRYAFLVTGGNIDSMVSNYTAAKKKRSDDAYSPGGKAGKRPDRAVTAYSRAVKEQYADSLVILGGLEASLRRFAHYDYWSDSVRPSVLAESNADVLVYGMGEHAIRELAGLCRQGYDPQQLWNIRGICFFSNSLPSGRYREVASFEKVKLDKLAYAKASGIQLEEQDAVRGERIIQKHDGRYLIQNAPQPPLSRKELDEIAALPYMRRAHPFYEKQGGVPAIQEVEFSIIHNRGCFGSCNFCSIAFHQGRYVTSRSEESILKEAKILTELPGFKGYIHDVGGPTANFRNPSCEKQETKGTCKNRKCLAPTPCGNLKVSHEEYLSILRKLRQLDGVKKVFIRSGIRFDYLMLDKDECFFEELVAHHISGQLKVAPEHSSSTVLQTMGKPPVSVFLRFKEKFEKLSAKYKKEQYLVPYLMSSHPGCDLSSAIGLSLFLKREGIRPEQVQDFYPTPATPSTTMFYTGLDPVTLKSVYVPKSDREKSLQRALLQFYKPDKKAAVIRMLKEAGREDLLSELTGTSPKANTFEERQKASGRSILKGTGKKSRGKKKKR